MKQCLEIFSLKPIIVSSLTFKVGSVKKWIIAHRETFLLQTGCVFTNYCRILYMVLKATSNVPHGNILPLKTIEWRWLNEKWAKFCLIQFNIFKIKNECNRLFTFDIIFDGKNNQVRMVYTRVISWNAVVYTRQDFY